MTWVITYGVVLLAIVFVAYAVGTIRQRTLASLIFILWGATLFVQIATPLMMPEWAFALGQFIVGTIMLLTASKNKWQLALASWYIPMMAMHVIYSLVEPKVYETNYSYWLSLTILGWAQLLTFGLWLVLDYGNYITDPIHRYFARRSRISLLQRKIK